MLSKIFQLIRIGDIRVNKEQKVEGKELDYILIGALESSLNFAYLNSYTTGLNDIELKVIVEDKWQIKSREEALETLSNLIKQNQDQNLNLVYKATEKTNYKEYLKTKLPEDKIAFQHYLLLCEDLKRLIPHLLQENVLKSYKEPIGFKDTAYNMARGALLARCCYDLGYFNKTVTKSILIGLYKALKKDCKTWEAYTKSYILGRSLQGYNDFKDIQFLAQKLLTNRKSPLNERVII